MRNDTSSARTGQDSMGAKRAVIYTRVSTQEQSEKGVSLGAQKDRCEAYCVAAGLEVSEVFREEGVSAKVPLANRPEGARLVAALNTGAVKTVVAFKLDRLFRDVVDALQQTRHWDGAGVSLRIVDLGGQAVDTKSAAGKFVFGMLAAVAEMERGLIGERTAAALRSIAEKGRVPANVPFGYRRENKELVHDPVEGPVVTELFARAAKGESRMQLARWINEKHPKRPHKKYAGKTVVDAAWRANAISRMLANPVYFGQVKWDGLFLAGNHQPLVSPGDWYAVQEAAKRRATSRLDRGNGAPAERLGHYTHLLRCGEHTHEGAPCPGPIGITGAHQRGSRRLIYYFCRARFDRTKDKRHESARIEESLFARILFRHTELLLSDGSVQDAAHELLAGEPGGDANTVAVRLKEVAEERRLNVRLLKEGVITEEDLRSLNAPLVAEEARLRETRTGSPTAGLRNLLDELSELSVTDILARVKEKPVNEQVTLLSGLYARIELLPGKLRFHHRDSRIPAVERAIPPFRGPKLPRDLGF